MDARLPGSLRAQVFRPFALLLGALLLLVISGIIWLWPRIEPASRDAAAMAAMGLLVVMMPLILWVWSTLDRRLAQPLLTLNGDIETASVQAIAEQTPSSMLGQLPASIARLQSDALEARKFLEEQIMDAVSETVLEKNRLATALRDLNQGVVVCTMQGVIQLYNREATRLIEMSGNIGLGRRLPDMIEPLPLHHALDRLLKRLTTERHGQHPDGLSVNVITTTRGGLHTLDMRVALTLEDDQLTPSGFVVIFSDATNLLSTRLASDHLIADLLEALRQAVSTFSLVKEAMDLPAARSAMQGALDGAVWDFSSRLEGLAGREMALRGDAWPMSNVNASALLERIVEDLDPATTSISDPAGEEGYIRCDSLAICSIVRHIASRIIAELSPGELHFGIAQIEGGVSIDITWPGGAVQMMDLNHWLDEPMGVALHGSSGHEILRRHRSLCWSDAPVKGQGRLRFPIPVADMSAQAGRLIGINERPEYFDFCVRQVDAGRMGITPLRELNFVIFDTETTGLEPSRGDEIVQISAVRMVNNRLLQGEVFDTLVNPQRLIPSASTRIHGISNEMVADAPVIATALKRFHRFAEGAVLVAHNAAFDMKFLQLKEKATGYRFDHPVLDTVLLSAILFGETGDHTLDSLAERFGVTIPPEARHTALGDARATAEVFLHLQRRLETRGLLTLNEAMQRSREMGRIRRMQAQY